MAIQLEEFLGGIRENGLNTQENTNFSGSTNTINNPTFTGTIAGGARTIVNVNSANGTSPTLTVAQSGARVLMNATTGSLITLPAAASGLDYEFVVVTAATSGSHGIVTASSSTFLVGGVLASTSQTGTVATFYGDGTSQKGMHMNGTTTGGSVGTVVRATAISTTQWLISGNSYGSGVITTPFFGV